MELLSHDEAVRQKWLLTIKEFFVYVEVLEAASYDHAGAAEFLKEMEWPHDCPTRENLSYLSATELTFVYAWLYQELRQHARGHSASLPVENLVGQARRQA